MYNPLIDYHLDISQIKYVIRYIDKLLIGLLNISMFEYNLLLNTNFSMMIFNNYVTNLTLDNTKEIKFIKILDDITDIFFADNEDNKYLLYNYLYPITRTLNMEDVIRIGSSEEYKIDINNYEILFNEFKKIVK